MKPLLQKAFLSSTGDGSISQFWKGALVLAIGYFAPEASESDVAQIAQAVIVAAGAVWSAYGLMLKLKRERWSAVP